MSLITGGSIHKGHKWFSNDSRGRQEIYVYVWLLHSRHDPSRIDTSLATRYGSGVLDNPQRYNEMRI